MDKQPKKEALEPFLVSERNRAMIEMRKRGISFADIARIFRVTRQYVAQIYDQEITKVA